MNKLLPLEESVPFRSYPQYAFFLGILAADGSDVRYTLFNHFITLCYARSLKQIGILELPFFLSYFSLRFFSAKQKDPLSYFKKQIKAGKYVQVWLNHKYLSASNCNNDFVHNFLVYGFDDAEQAVYAYGYVRKNDFSGMLLKKIRIPYAEFLRSYETAKRKKSIDKNDFVISVRRPADTKLHIKKLKLVLFVYLHDLLPSLPILPVNQHVYGALQKNIRENGANGYRAVSFPIWKFLEERAAFFHSLAGQMGLSAECQENCRKMKKILSSALLFSAVRNASKDCPPRYYEEAAQTFFDNLAEVRILEKKILSDIYHNV
ncbi:MAG: hypothetical protein IJT27_09505 [Clostridia bacterium]|nr:hypothetical protein [Clostridia bacterium]